MKLYIHFSKLEETSSEVILVAIHDQSAAVAAAIKMFH
jgi:hypothetical protein